MENQTETAPTAAETEFDAKMLRLLHRREELILARDILALQLEIRELKEVLDGNSDTKES